MIEPILTKLNESLAKDQEIIDSGSKTHEYRPYKRP